MDGNEVRRHVFCPQTVLFKPLIGDWDIFGIYWLMADVLSPLNKYVQILNFSKTSRVMQLEKFNLDQQVMGSYPIGC